MKRNGTRVFALCMILMLVLGTLSLASAQDKTKIVFLRAGTEVEKRDAFAKIIANFEAANPDIEVEYQESPWGSDIETKLNTGFASGTAPDVINFSLASMGQRIPLGQYEPLNSYTEGWEGLEDFFPSVLAAGSVGDTLYGIAYMADPRVIAYNKDLFEKAGLDPNAPPTNWEELTAYHEKLIVRDADGNVIQTGVGMPTTGFSLFQWLSIFGFQNGVKNLVDEATDEILFNTPPMVEAMEYLDNLRRAGVIPWDSSKTDQNPIRNGTAAISIVSPNEFKSMNIGDMVGKLAMADPVSHLYSGTFCGMHFMFMNSQSKNKEAAWRFIEFITSRESMEIWSQDVGTAPLRASLSDAYVATDPEQAAYIMSAIASGTGAPKVAYSNTLFNIVNEAMEKIYYERSGIQEALDEAAEMLAVEIENQ